MGWMKRVLPLMLLAGVAGMFAGCASDDHDPDHDPYRVHYGSDQNAIVVHEHHNDDGGHVHMDDHRDYGPEYSGRRDYDGHGWDGRDLDHP